MFVTVEGPNGVGKSSFIHTLKTKIGLKHSVFCTKEPTVSELGQKIRHNEDNLRGWDYAKMIAKDRNEHLKLTVIPMQKIHDVVISDRYVESSLVLQTFDGVSIDDVWKLNENFLIPDLSVILYATEFEIQRRLNSREMLTHFEKVMSRNEELALYKEAGAFLTEKGYNILELTNESEDDFEKNTNIVAQFICNNLHNYN